METQRNLFEELNAVNVNDRTETKDTGKTSLTYLSWAWAWQEFRKRCPDAEYEIERFDGKPFLSDEAGYMVFTKVTAGGQTYEMWLPVMDSRNYAMKKEPYVVKTKYGEVNVASASMMDINKTIMRCLTKNLAMFGLGLYIYAGEDLPSDEQDAAVAKKKEEEEKAEADKKRMEEQANMPIGAERSIALSKSFKEWGLSEDFVLDFLRTASMEALTEKQMHWIVSHKKDLLKKQKEANNV